ncbi:MAG: protoporphyrinogen oxidase, partial [Acidimicrobiales bacterium]
MTGRVVVVGGGITGLAAAHHLVTVSPELEVLVLEATDRTGGKLRWGRVGPLVVDAGADGFLARQPEMAELVREIGLGDELVAPATGQAYIWARDALRPIPTPSVLGVPLDPDTVAATGIVGAEAVVELRRRLRADLAPLEGDATIGSVLRPRLGDEVFDMLVDPLLGGINAGAGDQMSIEASALQLADAARAGGSFAVALRGGVSDAAAAAGGPVFLGVRGGTGRVVESLRAELGPCVRLSSPVARVASGGSSWLVTARGGDVSADAVILTTPAPVTSRLLAPLAPAAADLIGAIELADAVLVTFVLPAGGIDHPLDGSGFLVPRATGLLMTACSWSSSKWEHYHDGVHTVL